ncbi:hypothetical protein [Microvirga thermotolerans]|uniref:Uncharacterized protein n=1 Tax=Microvirga thermotolerans TaxID=2651334 RepID=A0A5P9JU39_9HYPH|nr:hypothetical protein [Microvirga thermotolerans]QFU15146.1 hypothetical protein GDR74_02355 [Microvirga thermotolerans]QFU15155.1 hypothetical protein GDR74_02400 [Microvirga thermotolerans]
MHTDHSFTHIVSEGDIWLKAKDLKARMESTGLDTEGLYFEDLAHQVMVRDLRDRAYEMELDDPEIAWDFNHLTGELEVECSFATVTDMVAFKRAIA